METENIRYYEDALDNRYLIDDKPVPRCYIFPDGKFLHLDEYKSHQEVERTLVSMKVVKSSPKLWEGGSPTIEDLGCIRCNLLDEGFIMLSKIEPTYKQYDSLLRFLDMFLSRKPFWKYFSGLMILTPHQKSDFKVYDLDGKISDDFVDIIKDYYRTGRLADDWNVNESLEYDYGTPSVNGDDIFDTTQLGGFSMLASCIPGDKDNDYMKERKNMVGKIVQMSPNEYYEECARRFGTTVDSLKDSRSVDPKYIDELTRVITEKKKKFPMAFIDYTSNGSQEGLHRMMVAGNLFGWDHKFPVLIVDWYDKELHHHQEDEIRRRKINDMLDKVVDNVYRFEDFYDKDSFKDFISDELDRQLEDNGWRGTPTTQTKIGDDKATISFIDDELGEEEIIKEIDLSKIIFRNEDEDYDDIWKDLDL